MKRIRLKTVVLAAIGVAAAIQLVTIRHDNPPETRALATTPAPVTAILNRACADCHTHTTEWPWYSYVAPVSWLVGRDVHEGRRHMDLSEWGAYPAAIQAKKLAGISGMVQEGEMPPWFYLPMHPNARLTQEDVRVLAEWADSAATDGGTH